MRIRFPLYAQVATLVVVNIAIIFLLRLAIMSGPSHAWESVIYGPICDRLQLVSFIMYQRIHNLNVENWQTVLDEFGHFYGVELHIFDLQENQLAGKPIKLPKGVKEKIKELPITRILKTRDKYKDLIKKRMLSGEKPGGFFPIGPPPPHMAGGPPPPAFNFHNLPPELKDTILKEDTPPGTALRPPPRMFGPPGRGGGMPTSFFFHTSNPSRYWICAMIPISAEELKPGLLIAQTDNIWNSKLSSDIQYIFFGIFILFCLSLALWWPFVHSISNALRKLNTTTMRISEGEFDTTLSVNRVDEIGQLSSSINKMSGRLNNFVNGQKRFLGDIAHELSSPVARQKMALELLESKSTEEQKSLINDIKEESEQMSSLINELLAFSKAGIRGKETELTVVDLTAVINRSIERLSSSAAIIFNTTEKVLCLGDEILLERAISNILRNAVKYAGDAGPIEIGLNKSKQEVSLLISDRGPGVPQEAIDHLGEPFYRPDSSRTRSAGGVGLGLAIVKTCIETCQGSFSCRNGKEAGLEITIKLKACDEKPLS